MTLLWQRKVPEKMWILISTFYGKDGKDENVNYHRFIIDWIKYIRHTELYDFILYQYFIFNIFQLYNYVEQLLQSANIIVNYIVCI